jgi:hypothetical protein
MRPPHDLFPPLLVRLGGGQLPEDPRVDLELELRELADDEELPEGAIAMPYTAYALGFAAWLEAHGTVPGGPSRSAMFAKTSDEDLVRRLIVTLARVHARRRDLARTLPPKAPLPPVKGTSYLDRLKGEAWARGILAPWAGYAFAWEELRRAAGLERTPWVKVAQGAQWKRPPGLEALLARTPQPRPSRQDFTRTRRDRYGHGPQLLD